MKVTLLFVIEALLVIPSLKNEKKAKSLRKHAYSNILEIYHQK